MATKEAEWFGTKALDKLEHIWHVSETERRQVWLEGVKEQGVPVRRSWLPERQEARPPLSSDCAVVGPPALVSILLAGCCELLQAPHSAAGGSALPCGALRSLVPLQHMWDLPGPRIDPLSSVLAGGFLTTGPPGKSLDLSFVSEK